MLIKPPESQDVLFGFEKTEQMLVDLFQQGSLEGSWLICGAKGVGKATLAYRLARFVLSNKAQEAQVDLFGASVPISSLYVSENDHIFKMLEARSCPDLKVVERDLKDTEKKERQDIIDSGKPLDPNVEQNRKRFDEIRVSEIRDLKEFLRRTSCVGGFRVAIIDCADDLNFNAQNALLKSLEEPPPNALILLISHNAGRLLPTVRSRCRRLILKPLPDLVLKQILSQYLPEKSDADLLSLALLSEGSLGQALSFAQSDGVSLFSSLIALFKDFPNISIPALYGFSEKDLKEKEKMKLAQSFLIWWLSRLCMPFACQEITAGEGFIADKIRKKLPVLGLIGCVEEITSLFKDTDLDQKQTFVSACLLLQKGAR